MKFIKTIIDYKVYAESKGIYGNVDVVVKSKNKTANLTISGGKVEMVKSGFSPKKTKDIIETVTNNKESIENGLIG